MVQKLGPLEPALDFKIAPLAGPGRRGGYAKPPVKKAATVLAQGPAYLYLARTVDLRTGPREPPPGFVTATTSATEWNIYWALSQIYGDPKDPRKGPFFGAKLFWGYQIGLDGSRSAGGAVVDFLIYNAPNGRRLGIRVQTQYFHLGSGSGKIASDAAQLASLQRYIDVYDLYDTEVLNDRTGQKSIVATKLALSMIRQPDPIFSGTAPANRSV